MLIIDVAAFGEAIGKWMVGAFTGDSLFYLSVSYKRAAELHPTRPRTEVVSLLTKQLQYLFGADAAGRQAARHEDILAFRKSQRARYEASQLKVARDTHAHFFGDGARDKVESIGTAALARELRRCGRILNAIRLLVNCSTYDMPDVSVRRGSRGAHATDLVDLLVLGDVRQLAEQFAFLKPNEPPYLWQRRARAYRRRSRKVRRSAAA